MQLVRRIREVLSFETETSALFVNLAASPDKRSGKEIARVKLHAWLVGVHGHHPASPRFRCYRNRKIVTVANGAWPGDYEIVIVAAGNRDLGIARVANPIADPPRFREIERRSRHGYDFTGRDQRIVDRRVVGREQLQPVIENRSLPLSRQVK